MIQRQIDFSNWSKRKKVYNQRERLCLANLLQYSSPSHVSLSITLFWLNKHILRPNKQLFEIMPRQYLLSMLIIDIILEIKETSRDFILLNHPRL